MFMKRWFLLDWPRGYKRGLAKWPCLTTMGGEGGQNFRKSDHVVYGCPLFTFIHSFGSLWMGSFTGRFIFDTENDICGLYQPRLSNRLSFLVLTVGNWDWKIKYIGFILYRAHLKRPEYNFGKDRYFRKYTESVIHVDFAWKSVSGAI